MNETTKKISRTVVALLVMGLLTVAAMSGYLLFIPKQENKLEQQIAAFIESLPGNLTADTITVSALGKSAKIYGLRGTTHYFGSDVNVDIASLALNGVNFTPGKGVTKIADSLIISGISITETANPDQPQDVAQDIAIKSLELHNVWGDLNTAADLVGDAPLARKIEIAAAFSAGPMRMQGYAVTMHTMLGPIILSLDSSEAQGASLLTGKNTVSKNLRLTAFDTDIIRLDRMSAASVKIPNILAPLLEFMEMDLDFDTMHALVLEKLRQEPVEMRGVVMEGFRLQLMAPEPITINKLSMDLDAAADRLAFKKEIQGLTLPPAIYGSMSLEARLFSKFYAKPLDLDLRKDVTLAYRSGAPVAITINDLLIRDKNLASAQLKAELLYTGDAQHVHSVFGSDPDDFALKNATLTLTDKALVATFLEAEFAGEVADMREKVAQTIVALSGFGGESFVLMAEGLAKLIRTPGTLTITGTPELPVNLGNPRDVIVKALKLTVDYKSSN
jgi:hypothetical protein